MSKPEGYFFVITPLHYLCAMEARERYGKFFGKSHLIVVGTYGPTLTQYEAMVPNDGWDSVRYRPQEQQGQASKGVWSVIRNAGQSKRFLDPVLCKIGKEDWVFFGNIQNPMTRYSISKSISEHTIVLDDGLATVDYFVNKLYNEKESLKLKRGLLYKWLLPYKKPDLKKLTIFSMYKNLDVQPASLEWNTFTYMRSKSICKEQRIGNDIVFVGQTLPQAGIVLPDIVKEGIEKIRKRAIDKGVKFTYYAHRSDVDKHPENWNVVYGDKPLELFFFEKKELPSEIWSFYSSALPNMKLIFGSNTSIYFLEPPSYAVSDKHKNTLSSIYEYLRNNQNMFGQVVKFDLNKSLSIK